MIDTLRKGIYSQLSGSTALTAQLSSVSAIYYGQAPHEAVLPYIVFFYQAGGTTNDSPIASADVRYVVKAIADTVTKAEQIAGLARTALHEQTLTLDAPWVCIRCQDVSAFAFVETEARNTFHHAGNTYRIRISQ